jgi:hypothetical protein
MPWALCQGDSPRTNARKDESPDKSKPDISNNAGSCQEVFCIFCSLFSFFGHTTPFTPKSGLSGSVKLCFDDHGSFVIFRSVSVRSR